MTAPLSPQYRTAEFRRLWSLLLDYRNALCAWGLTDGVEIICQAYDPGGIIPGKQEHRAPLQMLIAFHQPKSVTPADWEQQMLNRGKFYNIEAQNTRRSFRLESYFVNLDMEKELLDRVIAYWNEWFLRVDSSHVRFIAVPISAIINDMDISRAAISLPFESVDPLVRGGDRTRDEILAELEACRQARLAAVGHIVTKMSLDARCSFLITELWFAEGGPEDVGHWLSAAEAPYIITKAEQEAILRQRKRQK